MELPQERASVVRLKLSISPSKSKSQDISEDGQV